MPDKSPAQSHWMDNAPLVPTDIKVKRAEQKVIVQWPDGVQSTYDAAVLRKNCPCAACRGERQKQADNPLHIMGGGGADDITLTGAELVGQYAIKLVWSDGHDTGIYDYRYLRTLPNC